MGGGKSSSVRLSVSRPNLRTNAQWAQWAQGKGEVEHLSGVDCLKEKESKDGEITVAVVNIEAS